MTGAQSLRLPTSIDPGTDFDFATGVVSDGAGGFYLTVGHDQLDETWPGGVIHYVPGGALSAVTDPSAFYSPWDVAVVPVPEPSTLALLALGCAVLARLRASASS